MIKDFNELDLTKQYTYSDYLTWQFKERVELIRGWVMKMSPAPNRRHQRVSRIIERSLDNFLVGTNCEMYHAPFDVLLSRQGNDTVVQPDICVICDKSKLTEQGCTGAPDLVIEILSPGNSRRELKEKFELYEENGVQEYWIADPANEDITIYTLNEAGKYIGSKPFVAEEVAQSQVLENFGVVVGEIFEE